MKNGGFQKRDPPLTFAVHLTFGILFACKMGTITTSPKKLAFLRVFLGTVLSCFLHRHLLQMVFVKVKTAGYQP